MPLQWTKPFKLVSLLPRRPKNADTAHCRGVMSTDGLGEVKYDLGYGGAFYALVDVHQLNMDFDKTPVEQLEAAGTAIKKAIM